MIREGTRGAEGKNKGMERKTFERAKRRQRQEMKSLRSQARWAKYKNIKPCPRRVHEEIRSAHRNVLEIPSARTLREIIYSKRNSKRKTREGSTDLCVPPKEDHRPTSRSIFVLHTYLLGL